MQCYVRKPPKHNSISLCFIMFLPVFSVGFTLFQELEHEIENQKSEKLSTEEQIADLRQVNTRDVLQYQHNECVLLNIKSRLTQLSVFVSGNQRLQEWQEAPWTERHDCGE